MKTDNAKYTRHIYQLEPNECKFLEYSLQIRANGKISLPDIVRIEENRKFNKGSGFSEIFRLIDKPLIKDCKTSTGLRPIEEENCFYGDLVQTNTRGEIVSSFILVQFVSDRKTMIVDYFRGFKPFNVTIRNEVITKHQFQY